MFCACTWILEVFKRFYSTTVVLNRKIYLLERSNLKIRCVRRTYIFLIDLKIFVFRSF